MTKKPSLNQAKQGDPQEIAALITYLMKEQEVLAFAELKQDYLEITLESNPVPPQQSSVIFVQGVMENLNCPYIKSVVIQGKELGLEELVWTECISLEKKQKTVKEKLKASLPKWLKWPGWFPYPNSWFRTFLLIIWIAFVVKVTTFWGSLIGGIMSDLATDPKPFLKALGIAFLASGIIFSYAHHWMFNRSLRHFSAFTPHYRSLWEGTYALIVLFLSVLIVLAVLIPFYPVESCSSYISNNFQVEYCRFGDHQEWLQSAGLLQIFCFLYLYQIEYIIRHDPKLKKNVILMGCIGLIAAVSVPLYSRNIENIKTARSWVVSYLPDRVFPEEIKTASTTFIPTITEENTETQPETDSFREAVKTATKAANLAQTAKTPNEWNAVATEWEYAIEFMQSVADSDDNYSTAQDRIEQYQRNLEYSQKNATPKPPEPYLQQGLNEASSAALLAQTAKSKDEWGFVASQWEKAIENMKAVSSSDVNYAKAQQRIIQYQKNRNYAWLAASKAK